MNTRKLVEMDLHTDFDPRDFETGHFEHSAVHICEVGFRSTIVQ